MEEQIKLLNEKVDIPTRSRLYTRAAWLPSHTNIYQIY